MRIEIPAAADDEMYEAFQRLIPQLTQNNPPPSLYDLRVLVQDGSSTLMIARNDQEQIIGALTLIVYRVPTGIRSVIEDVVVESSERGRGVGEALIVCAVELARQKGASNLTLTSNPMRVAANKLYVKMGFQRRNTNAYQLKL